MDREKEQIIVSAVALTHDDAFEMLMDDAYEADFKDVLKDEEVIREWLDDKAKQGFFVDGLFKHSEKVTRIRSKFPSLCITATVPRDAFQQHFRVL